jgi:molybdopterin-binding protein
LCSQQSQGKGKEIVSGAVNTEVIIELSGDDQVTSIVTKDSLLPRA